jgi:hypothetical protein
MKNKSLLKFVVAFGLLSIILIFLGVNYVPRTSASSSVSDNIVSGVSVTRANYIDELYPRAIVPQLSYTGSDWLNHHPFDVTQKLSFTASDWLNHHPFDLTQQLTYAGSDWIERHPSNYYSNSDWIERQLYPQIVK